MDKVSIIGIDLAKHSFQLHGALSDGSVGFRKKLSRENALRGGDGGLRERPLLGPGDRGSWSRGPLDPADIRQAVCQAPEERRGGGGGDLRGCAAPEFCGGEDGGAAGDAVRDLLVRQQTINALPGHLTEFGIVAPQVMPVGLPWRLMTRACGAGSRAGRCSARADRRFRRADRHPEQGAPRRCARRRGSGPADDGSGGRADYHDGFPGLRAADGELHTRWISKGKAGCPVELGVPVSILEYGFILHHEVMWAGSDVDYAVPMVAASQAWFPNLRAVSFDRGFHSPDNRLMRCLITTCCRRRGISMRRSGSACRARSSLRCAVSIRRWNRRSTT